MPFVRKSVATFLSQVSIFVSRLATGIITARVLGPHDRGLYSIAVLIHTIGSLAGNFGIGNANVYLLGKKKHSPAEVVAGSILLAFLFGGLVTVAFLFLRAFNLSLFQKVSAPVFGVIVAAFPFSLLSLYIGNVFQGIDRFLPFNSIEVLRAILRLVFIGSAVGILGWGVLGAASGWAVAEAVVGVTSAVVIFRLIGPALKLSTKCLKEMLSFGIRSYAELFFLYLNYQIDMIMVSVYTAPEQVGYYSIAFSISRMILILPTSIGIVLYPRLSSLRVEEADFFTARVMRNVIFVISIGLVAVAFLSKWIIQIMYGKAYLPATRPLLWLLPGVLAISMYKQLTRNFLSRGKPIYGAYISGFGLASAVLMNLLFIPRFGIAGAAAASSLAFLGMALIALVLFIKTSDINLMDAVFVRSDDLQDLREHVNALKKKFSNF